MQSPGTREFCRCREEFTASIKILIDSLIVENREITCLLLDERSRVTKVSVTDLLFATASKTVCMVTRTDTMPFWSLENPHIHYLK